MLVEERTQYQTEPAMSPPVLPPPAARAATPVPARPPEHHSRVGQITFSLSLLAIGALGIVDLAGAKVPGSAYLATPLTVIGLGLLTAAWYGRARWLIGIGVALTVVLGIATVAERVALSDGSVIWQPTTVEQLESEYRVEMGNAVLDLSNLDFAGQSPAVRVEVGAGNLTIIVPANVDVRAEASVDVGNADVFGTRWGGIGSSEHTITDNGDDGPGGGSLVIQATVDVGNLEVRR